MATAVPRPHLENPAIVRKQPETDFVTTIHQSLTEAFTFFVRVVKTILLLLGVVWDEAMAAIRGRRRKDIRGQLAMVTGGSNGLGRLIALRLAREGCNVIVVDVDEKEAYNTCVEVKKLGVKASFFKTDVSVYEDVQLLCDRIEAEIAPIDILVNNAGLMPLISHMRAAPVDIERLMAVNVKAHFWTVKVLLDRMIQRKRGHIVAISSMAGIESTGGLATYCATKFAIRGFMDALHEELRYGGHRDTVFTTTVFPFFLDTRGDVCDAFCKNRTSTLQGDHVAGHTVEGILTNRRYVSLPWGMMFLATFGSCLPESVQHPLRDMWKPKFQHLY